MEFQLTGRLDELGRIQCVQANCTGTQGAPAFAEASGCLKHGEREMLQRTLDSKVDELALLMMQLGELSKRMEMQEKLIAQYEEKFKRQDRIIRKLSKDRTCIQKEVENITDEHPDKLLSELEESMDSNATALSEEFLEHRDTGIESMPPSSDISDTKNDKRTCKGCKCSYGVDNVESGWRTFSYTESFAKTRTSVADAQHLTSPQCSCPRFDDGEAIHCTFGAFSRKMRLLQENEKKQMLTRTEGDGCDEVDGLVGLGDEEEQKEEEEQGFDDVDGIDSHHICKAPSAVRTETKEEDHNLPLYCTKPGPYVEISEEHDPLCADVISTSESETQILNRYHRDGPAPRLPQRSPRRLSGATVPENLVTRVRGTKVWIDAMKVLQNLFNFSEEGAEENLRIILKDCNTVFTIDMKETYSLVKNGSSKNERIKMFRKKLGKRYGRGVLKRIEHYIVECINVCSYRTNIVK